MIGHFLTETAIVTPRKRAAEENRHGVKPLEDGTPVPDLACWHHPASAEEQTERPTGTTTHLAYFLAGVAVDTRSKITIAGTDFEVAAPPARWNHPSYGPAFVVVEMIEGPA